MKKLLLSLLLIGCLVALPACGGKGEETGTFQRKSLKEKLQEENKTEGIQLVDLGLSVKWADRNVGAAASHEFGDYLDFNRAYQRVDEEFGGNYRLPSIEEMHELLELCTWEEETIEGNNGYRVTGPNGNSIFFPAAGYFDDEITGENNRVNTWGEYWSYSPIRSWFYESIEERIENGIEEGNEYYLRLKEKRFLTVLLLPCHNNLPKPIVRIALRKVSEVKDKIRELIPYKVEDEELEEVELIEIEPAPPPVQNSIRLERCLGYFASHVQISVRPVEMKAGEKEGYLQAIDFALHGDIEEIKSVMDSVERKLYPEEFEEFEVLDEPKSESDTLYFVDEMPVFPGGDMALMEYISKNLKYPQSAQDAGIEGRVVIRFVVKKDGSIGDVQVARGLEPSCDKESVRVVKTLPRFTPGKQDGQPVNVWFTLPITFKLVE